MVKAKYRQALIARNRSYVDEVRAATVCEDCGRQPIQWHHDDHVEHPNRRVSKLTRDGYSIATIQAEIDRCVALCQRCHMKRDGRGERFGGLHKRPA